MNDKYTSIFKSLASTLDKHKTGTEELNVDQIVRPNIDNVHTMSNEMVGHSFNDAIKNVVVSNLKECVSTSDYSEELLFGYNLQCSFDVSNNKSICNEKIKQELPVKGHKNEELFQQIKSLHCLFTWDLKSHKKQNIITRIQNKYGCDDLDLEKYLPTPEFTFLRFVGNLIISYELYKNGELDASYKKILDIGNWLEKLDNSNDEFYLSISIGLKHIKVANFIHMLFVASENGGFKRLLNEIVLFDNMDNTSKAVVHAIHAIILIEYGENLDCFKHASQYAKKSCELDPKTSYWFHIYALVLMAERQFMIVHKIKHNNEKQHAFENEIQLTIQQAIMSLGVKRTHSINSLFSQLLKSKIPKNVNESPVYKKTDVIKYHNEKNLEEDMKIIVWKYRNGEDPVLYLNDMVPKYKGFNRWKIMAEICSYIVLFTNDLRAGVEQFLVLIDELEISTSDIIINHNSTFVHSTEPFNLAELIYNEMKLATTNLTGTSFENILFFYEMMFKIEKTCDLKMKVVDLPIKHMLVCNSLVRFSNSNETELFENNTRKDTPKKNMTSKTHKIKSNEFDVIDFKVLNPLPFGIGHSYSSDHVSPESLINFQIQTEAVQYILSQNIAINTHQYNFNSNTYQDANRYLTTNLNNLNSFGQFQCNSNLKLDITHQSLLYTNNIITTNVTSDTMIVDTSLHKLPKSSSKSVYKACLKTVLKNYPHSFKIYTDASKLDDNVGIAIVSDKNDYCYKLSSDYTSSDAEAVAILRALDYALAENIYDFVILSDSLTTIKCIQNLNTDSSDVIKSIVCLLHAHKLKKNIVQFIWVPGHNAIEGNEKADKLAKQIALSETAVIYSHNSFKIKNCK